MLRDTGRMTFDELVRKHLGLDPATQQFWDGCIDEALSHLTKFKSIVQNPYPIKGENCENYLRSQLHYLCFWLHPLFDGCLASRIVRNR